LQTRAQRSIHQKGFVGVARVLGAEVRWRSGGNLVDLIFGSGAEAALLPGLWPPRTFRHLLRSGLQIERPLHIGRARRRSGDYLHILVGRLEPEHLHFQRVGSRREIGQFVGPGLIGGGDHAVSALSGDHGGARQRLPAELDGSRLSDGGLRTQQRAQRYTQSHKPKGHEKGWPEH
jgi:hypothetical protein